ncbi:MAG: hypothetical protein AB7O39_12665 [Flavobacteriaceae bacterium]
MVGTIFRLARLAVPDIAGVLRRAKWRLAAYLAMAWLFAVAIAFSLVALFQYLAIVHGPVAAGLIIAAGSLSLAFLILLAVHVSDYIQRRARRRINAQQALQAAALLSQVSLLARRKPTLAALAVGGLAFLVLRGRRDD